MLPAALTFDSRLSHGAVRVAMALQYHARHRPTCYPGNARLAKLACCSENRMRNVFVPELERAGWVRRERGPGPGGRVFILMWMPGAREALAALRPDMALMGTDGPGGVCRRTGGVSAGEHRSILREEEKTLTATVPGPGDTDREPEPAQEPAVALEPASGPAAALQLVAGEPVPVADLERRRQVAELGDLIDHVQERQADHAAQQLRGMVNRARAGEPAGLTLEQAVAGLRQDRQLVQAVGDWIAEDLQDLGSRRFYMKQVWQVHRGEEPPQRLLAAHAAGLAALQSSSMRPGLAFQRAWSGWRQRVPSANTPMHSLTPEQVAARQAQEQAQRQAAQEQAQRDHAERVRLQVAQEQALAQFLARFGLTLEQYRQMARGDTVARRVAMYLDDLQAQNPAVVPTLEALRVKAQESVEYAAMLQQRIATAPQRIRRQAQQRTHADDQQRVASGHQNRLEQAQQQLASGDPILQSEGRRTLQALAAHGDAGDVALQAQQLLAAAG